MTQAELNIESNGIYKKPKEKSTAPFRQVIANRDFRLLWIGEAISLLGDQFHMIALPWLVLQLTGDAFLMGTVLAVAAIPRAIFMLLGGVITDRYSPRNVMLASNIIRMMLVIALTGVVLTGTIEIWMIYIISLLFGLADAFYFPASQAIVPSLIPNELLQTGNALVQGTIQVSVFLGPVLAGFMITLLSAGAEGDPSMAGIGLAFGLNALTFLFSALTLLMMSSHRLTATNSDADEQSVIGAIKEGFSFILSDKLMTKVFAVSVAINFLLNGPIVIGIPVLADTQYPEGAAAFGMIMSGFGGGALIGIIMAGALPRPNPKYMGTIIMIAVSCLGIAEVILVATNSTLLATLAVAVAGAGNGYVNVMLITWLQSAVPSRMIGRMMSVLMFASAGTAPIGHAVTGALVSISPVATMSGAGVLVMLTAAWMLRDKDINAMGFAMETNPQH